MVIHYDGKANYGIDYEQDRAWLCWSNSGELRRPGFIDSSKGMGEIGGKQFVAGQRDIHIKHWNAEGNESPRLSFRGKAVESLH